VSAIFCAGKFSIEGRIIFYYFINGRTGEKIFGTVETMISSDIKVKLKHAICVLIFGLAIAGCAAPPKRVETTPATQPPTQVLPAPTQTQEMPKKKPPITKIDPTLKIPPPVDEPTPIAPTNLGVVPNAVIAARDTLAKKLKVEATQIRVVGFEEREWPDGCLGAAQPDEMCLQVITPGWWVNLEFDGKPFIYHTDATGQVARQARPIQPTGP
jgi:hypothetical protein